MSTTQPLARVADQLTEAFGNGDAEQLRLLFGPGAVVWHNTDEAELDAETTIAGMEGFRAVCDVTLRVLSRQAFDQGFVQSQRWTFRSPSGDAIELASVFWVTVNASNQIVRLDEYIDGVGLAAVAAMLEPADPQVS